jgi:predicted nucleic acid-binding protein
VIFIPIYVDSSVWLNYFLPDNSDYYQRAKTQIERIKDNSDYFLISFLVMMEIIGVIRQRVIEREEHSGLSTDKIQEIKLKAQREVEKVLSNLDALQEKDRLRMINPTGNASDFHNHTLCLLQNLDLDSIGKIEDRRKCSKCRTYYQKPKYKLVCLGHYDFQHAFIAKQHSTTEIISSDRAFLQLPNFEEFKDIKITIV